MPSWMTSGCETKDTSQTRQIKNRHVAPVEKEECKYLKPIQRHVYTELTEESELDTHARQQEIEDAYEPVGSMEQLE